MSATTGLAGVSAGETAVSLVDGQGSRLVYRGYSIGDLAGRTTFEETAFLLLEGRLPNATELADFSARLQEEQDTLPIGLLRYAQGLAQHGVPPMPALRAVLAQAAASDADAQSVPARRDVCLRLVARAPRLLAAAVSRRDVERTYARAPFAQDALAALLRRNVERPEAADFDTCLVLHAEHSFNASTFTARVVASTEADPYSAVIAAMGALVGPLHGGASAAAARMFEEVGEPVDAAAYVERALAEGRKIPGFGHRVYKTGDPRARILLAIAERQAARDPGSARRLAVAKEIERAMAGRKATLYPNVDFFSAVVYVNLGLDPEILTAVFAVARMPGWAAHVLEQYEQATLIRPSADYVGPDGLAWRPLAQR